MDELVINTVKLGLMLLIPCALCLPCSQTAGIIGVILERGKLAQRVDAALKGDLGAGNQLAVVGAELVLLRHLVKDRRRKGLVGDLSVDKHQVAVLSGKIRAERRIEHGAAPCVLALLQLRRRLVPEIHLLVVEGVAGVDRVAHTRKLGLRVDMLVELFLLEEYRARLGVAFGGLEPRAEVSELLLYRVQIGALIGHLGKLHGCISFTDILCVL